MYSLSAPIVPMLARVRALQSEMLAMPEHHIDIEPEHFFADGLYGRSGTIPAGTTAIGHIHAKEHLCVISQGRIQVVTENGVEEIIGPSVFIVPAGRKNCVYAIEDTTWTTIHACEAKTVLMAENLLIMPEIVGGKSLKLPHERSALCL